VKVHYIYQNYRPIPTVDQTSLILGSNVFGFLRWGGNLRNGP
jgi:hypothetical protein